MCSLDDWKVSNVPLTRTRTPTQTSTPTPTVILTVILTEEAIPTSSHSFVPDLLLVEEYPKKYGHIAVHSVERIYVTLQFIPLNVSIPCYASFHLSLSLSLLKHTFGKACQARRRCQNGPYP